MQNRVPVVLIQGAQWGSESKGTIAAKLCVSRNIDFAVRTGSVNAGHTVIYDGHIVKNQQLPTGWVNPRTQLVIGAGAYIHPEILQRELDEIKTLTGLDPLDRLWIDHRAGTHLPDHEGAAKEANRHHRIGATGKGCSEAIVDKIRNRNNGYKLFIDTEWGVALRRRHESMFVDVAEMLNTQIDSGSKVLIEGTQGTLLDLHLGPYPYTTSRMTSSANWVAECGLSPTLEYEIVLVARTFPIRVAGNSGPMPDEIEWSDLASEINAKLTHAGMRPMISDMVLRRWREALREAAISAGRNHMYMLPGGAFNGNIDLSTWTSAERNRFRVAASELHRDALALCDEEALRELGKLFEMTTVTRKLRRIARLNMPELQYACMLNRPSWICLTFLNYVEPVLWNWHRDHDVASHQAVGEALQRASGYIAGIEAQTGVPVRMASTGPLLDHVLDLDKDVPGLRRLVESADPPALSTSTMSWP